MTNGYLDFLNPQATSQPVGDLFSSGIAGLPTADQFLDQDLQQRMQYGAALPAGAGFTPQGGGIQLGADSMGFFDKGGMFDKLSAGGKALTGIMGAYSGMQQAKLAEEQFDFTKAAYNRDISNQAKLTNAELADRQNRRISASGPGHYKSTENYLRDNAVSGAPIG